MLALGETVQNQGLSSFDDITNGTNGFKKDISFHPGSNFYEVTTKSMHPGGFNLEFGDASVMFITNNITVTAYQLMRSMDDGQINSLND